MIEATKADKARIIDILIHAFRKNKSTLDIIGEHKGERRLVQLIGYALENCYDYGRVVLTDDRYACALVLFPDRKRITFRSIYRDLKLIVKVVGIFNLVRVLKRNSLIKKQHLLNKTYYIWFIGVFPQKQNMGIGTTLLSELIHDAKSTGRPVFLETSDPNNLDWYRKHDFELYQEVDIGYPLYFLNRF